MILFINLKDLSFSNNMNIYKNVYDTIIILRIYEFMLYLFII